MAKKNELLVDYKLLGKMSKDLQVHQKNVWAIGKQVTKSKARLDMKSGLMEDLEVISNHMRKAQEEIDSAIKRIKSI